MKVVVKRHAGEYQVYRVMAVAQAVKALGHEVVIDCLHEYATILALGGIGWKNPHEAYAWAERVNDDPAKTRKGGARFDLIINVDDDGPFQPRWMASGVSWWDWVKAIVGEAMPGLAVPDWPEITGLGNKLVSEPYCLIRAFGPERDPFSVNGKVWSAYASQVFPGIKQLWLSQVPLGGDYEVAKYATPQEMAGWVAGATGMIAGTGLAAAIAQSTVGGKPVCPNLHFVRHPEFRDKVRTQSGNRISLRSNSDPFARQRVMHELSLIGAARILQTQPDLSLAPIQGFDSPS